MSEPLPLDPLDVACPHCDALVGVPCVTTSGRVARSLHCRRWEAAYGIEEGHLTELDRVLLKALRLGRHSLPELADALAERHREELHYRDALRRLAANSPGPPSAEMADLLALSEARADAWGEIALGGTEAITWPGDEA